MKFLIALLLTVTVCLLIVLCALASEPESWLEEIHCESIAGDSVHTVYPGRLFCILLPENQTTPYRWEYAVSDNAAIEFVYDRYKSDPNPAQLDGVGGKHAFYFRAVRTGTYSIDMSMVRIGEAAEDAMEKETCEILIVEAPSAVNGAHALFQPRIHSWMEEVLAATQSAGLHSGARFNFRYISDLHRYFELKLAEGLVAIRLIVTDDLRPVAIEVTTNLPEKKLGAEEREERVRLMRVAFLACVAVTDSSIQDTRAEEIASVLADWLQEALERNVNMGHDEQEGRYCYSTMHDVLQRSADFHIADYPVFQDSFFDGMDTGVLEMDEDEAIQYR